MCVDLWQGMCIFMVYSFFFFKQKTAYKRRISDWSSDVCSSDLPPSLRSVTATIALFLALYRPDHNRSANADAVTMRVTPRRSSASKSALSPVTSQSARPASPRPSRKSSRRWTAGSRFGISASVGIVVERLFEFRKHPDRKLDWCSVWQFGKLEVSHDSGSPGHSGRASCREGWGQDV